MSSDPNRQNQGARDESAKAEFCKIYPIGKLGTMRSYLWVSEGSSSDTSNASSRVARVDTITAIPVLHWSPPNKGLLSQLAMQACCRTVDAIRLQDGRYPIVMQPGSDLRFSIQDSSIKIWNESGNAGIFQESHWPIDERFAWYLKESGTVSLILSLGDDVRVSIALDGRDHPLVGFHRGTLQHKNYVNIIERSQSWKFVVLGNMSLAADMGDVTDDHFDMYVSYQERSRLPEKLRVIGGCISCGTVPDSKEHCTPDWIARDQGVQPVTSHLFCRECNSYFGRELEQPLSNVYKSGRLPACIHTDLFAMWAIKTALTLSVASGGRINRQWMQSLRQGEVPGGFEIYAMTQVRLKKKGYLFGTTMFSASRHAKGAVLTTFGMPGLAFSVVRSDPQLGSVGPIARVYPSKLAAQDPSEFLDFPNMHAVYLEAITGSEVKFQEWNDGRGQDCD